jgi:hypothetical protein
MADILPIPSDACGCSACVPVVLNQTIINNTGGGSAELYGPDDPNDAAIFPDDLTVMSTYNQTDPTGESVVSVWKWNPDFQRWV